MAVVNISGVAYESISSIGGIAKTSIADIGGVTPGPVGPTCTAVYYGYNADPATSCLIDFIEFAFDSTNNVLYNAGACGVTQAPSGYYSDGSSIYSWSGGIWSYYSSCTPPPSCTTVYYGYVANDGSDPSIACAERQRQYELDTNTNILYEAGQCGVTLVQDGYYSDGTNIYLVKEGNLKYFGSCRR